MNLPHDQTCYLTFKSNKITAHTLTDLAHIQGMTQAELLQKICEEYIELQMIKIAEQLPKETLEKIIK